MAYPVGLLLRGGRSRPEGVDRATTEPEHGGGKDRIFACARCLTAVTTSGDRLAISANHEHTFANAHGIVFRIGCFAEASCVAAGESSTYWTWFPGYSWQVEHCRRCREHLGWLFRKAEHRFHGLVLDRLVERADES